ncbi:hypothetical protein M9434_004424 [Picochlorum sp. BPE23]|nr:hypothetical protein M9434_004424 [Picochlorum sp. BPE23]
MFCTSTTCFRVGSLILTFIAISGLLVYITTCIYAYIERDQRWDARLTLSRLIVNVSPKLSKVNRHRHSERLEDLIDRFRNQSCSALTNIDVSEQLRELNDEGGRFGAQTEVFLLGDSTVRNKFGHLDKLVNSSSCDIPYQVRVIDRHRSSCTNVFGTRFYYEPVMTAKELVAALDHLEEYWLGFDGNLVIIFNVGLHELHLYPVRKIDMDLDIVDNLQTSVRSLRNISEQRDGQTEILLKLTNHICSDKFYGDYSNALAQWHKDSTSAHQMCLDNILERFPYVASGQESKEMAYYICETMIFDNVGVRSINGLLLDAVKDSDIKVLDSYEMTQWFCKCTSNGDGRHYGPIVPLWWASTLSSIEL